ncbi:hypothetical protein [Hephaestia mangrovi]|uniref:hypothetical protein n=1 Tax=Hephaestia mangrovi TaxID=2873268 RepID=UPI001CA69A7F|nr:hypothetical protein [Hephaestia mangrovi]MBY8829809.1 hypothetical protein [Hephaestia mangrovi]
MLKQVQHDDFVVMRLALVDFLRAAAKVSHAAGVCGTALLSGEDGALMGRAGK